MATSSSPIPNASASGVGLLTIRVLLAVMLAVTAAGKLLHPAPFLEALGALGAGGLGLRAVFVAVIAFEVVLAVLLLVSPRPRRVLGGAGVLFAGLAGALVVAGGHLPGAACSGVEQWAGTGSGPAALARNALLGGMALLGATWRPAPPGTA